MVKIDLQPAVETELAAQAKARGLTFADYLRELLVKQAEQSAGRRDRQSIAAAIDGIRELRKGNKLGGLSIKDLIHEGHKH